MVKFDDGLPLYCTGLLLRNLNLHYHNSVTILFGISPDYGNFTSVP